MLTDGNFDTYIALESELVMHASFKACADPEVQSSSRSKARSLFDHANLRGSANWIVYVYVLLLCGTRY